MSLTCTLDGCEAMGGGTFHLLLLFLVEIPGPKGSACVPPGPQHVRQEKQQLRTVAIASHRFALSNYPKCFWLLRSDGRWHLFFSCCFSWSKSGVLEVPRMDLLGRSMSAKKTATQRNVATAPPLIVSHLAITQSTCVKAPGLTIN